MSDKEKYGGKVWFVRGVPAELRAEVAAAAERAGMKVGPWVERALRAALARPEGQGGVPAGQGGAADLAAQLAAVIERVERLEASQVEAAIPGLPSGDDGKGRVLPAIPSRQGSALDAVEPGGGVEVPKTAKTHPRPSGGAVKSKQVRGQSNRAIPAEHLEEADRLQAGGMSFAEIVGAKGWPYHRSGLAKALQRWREEKAEQGVGEEEPTTDQLLQMADKAVGELPPLERVRRVGEMMATDEPATEILKVLRGEPDDQTSE